MRARTASAALLSGASDGKLKALPILDQNPKRKPAFCARTSLARLPQPLCAQRLDYVPWQHRP